MTLPKEANTKIGVDSTFEGVFKAKGILLIEGSFKGDLIYSDQIYIANTANVESNIRGGAIFIEGSVKGNIFSDGRVVLLPGAKIFGDITTPELITQKGVILKGICNITQESGQQ